MERILEPNECLYSRCSNARIRFDPTWSPSMPYGLFVRGTAKCYRGSLTAAVICMRNDYGYTILTTKTPVEKTS